MNSEKALAIWKYPVSVDDTFTISMPEGAQILTVQMQMGRPCMWALVDPSRPYTSEKFRLFRTGNPIRGDLGEYVGTFQVHSGSLVFHLFKAQP